jgi:protein ImuA
MDLSTLPTAGQLRPLGERAPRWRPGLACAAHSEVFGDGREGSGAAMALSLMLDGLGPDGLGDRHLLWVQDESSLRLNGRPYRPGLPPALRRRVIHVAAPKPEDALFALEEGLRCRDLAGVIGEIAGNPKALDFTASRRLTLAAERYGVPLFLVRHGAVADLSSARMRWRAGGAASLPPRWNAAAPGAPAWHAELFRARGHAPGEWTLRDDGHVLAAHRAPDHGDLADAAGGRSLAAR